MKFSKNIKSFFVISLSLWQVSYSSLFNGSSSDDKNKLRNNIILQSDTNVPKESCLISNKELKVAQNFEYSSFGFCFVTSIESKFQRKLFTVIPFDNFNSESFGLLNKAHPRSPPNKIS